MRVIKSFFRVVIAIFFLLVGSVIILLICDELLKTEPLWDDHF